MRNIYFSSFHLPPWRTWGMDIAEKIKPELKGNDSVIAFGFCPTILSNLERKTPFPFIDSKVILDCSKRKSKVRKAVYGELNKALDNKNVKYLIIDPRDDLRIHRNLQSKVLLERNYDKPFYIGSLKLYKKKS